MRRDITIFVAGFIAVLAPITAFAQIWEGFVGCATPVEVNRELPRTPVISYPSEKLSREQGREPSRYFQPLTDWTTHIDSDNNTIYSVKYKAPFEWVDRYYFLHIGAANSNYVVIINGEFVGYNQSGRTAAEFDVTKFSVEGVNRLEIIVYADPASKILQSENVTPAITGETYITAQPRIRIRDYVAKVNIDGESHSLELGVIVKSHLLNDKTVRVYYSLENPDGSPGPYGHRDADFEMKLEDTVRFFVSIPDAKLWSHESPNLYTLLLKVQHEGRYTEYVTYKLGHRTIEVKNGEFMVNGMPVTINSSGYSFNGDIATTEDDLRRLKSKGVNTLVLRGHPESSEFYSICDRIGIYVCNTTDINTSITGNSRKKGGNPSNDPQWKEAYIDRALTMFHTSHNHPSVVMFSLADDSANGYNLYESFLALKNIEQNRPVIYLNADGEWNTDAIYTAMNGDYPAPFEKIALRNQEAEWETRPAIIIKPVLGNDPIVESIKDELFAKMGTLKGEYGFFSLINNQSIAPLNNLVVEWSVKQAGKRRNKGTFNIDGSIKSGNSHEMLIPYGNAKKGGDVSIEFTVSRSAELFDSPAPETKHRNKNNGQRFIKIGEQTVNVEL